MLRKHTRGFTLVELAIVLAVAGLLFVGLWRLLSGGNQQVRDQNAASQQAQLISSVKSYLATTMGQSVITALAANGKAIIPIPPLGTACNTTTPANTFACYLPSGFGPATVNSYGQTYAIWVLKDSSAATVPATTYSFIIVTAGGDTILDTSGGRISAFIGGDGGFVYSTNVCGGPTNMACGAYGAWAVDVNATYGAAVAAGHIASRTFVGTATDNAAPWLERNLSLQPDATFSWNTMSTDLYMGGTSAQAPAGFAKIFMAPFNQATGGSSINLQGGSILGTGTSNINISGDGTGIVLGINATGVPATPIPGIVNIPYNACTMTAPGVPGNCPYAISTTTINAFNLINAGAFYATTFFYQASDARLKTNIHPIANSLDELMKVKPVSFNYKLNGAPSFGVIAQELEKVYPQLVSEGSTGMKAVNYDGLIGPLISAVQELKQQNDDLRHQLHEQQLREDRLEKKMKSSGTN